MIGCVFVAHFLTSSAQLICPVAMQQRNSAVFTATNKVDDTYDAYERDIAIVSFYFEYPTAFEYIR